MSIVYIIFELIAFNRIIDKKQDDTHCIITDIDITQHDLQRNKHKIKKNGWL